MVGKKNICTKQNNSEQLCEMLCVVDKLRQKERLLMFVPPRAHTHAERVDLRTLTEIS
jgi:hypothetical protein